MGPQPTTRCGTIVLAGRPNVGKSTLLNALVGQPLAIVSPKPQSTRLPIAGIRTEDSAQLVFIDSPGLLAPTYALQQGMVAAALEALESADALLYLHPAHEGPAPPLATLFAAAGRRPRLPPAQLTVLTQADRAPAGDHAGTAGTLRTSAVTGQGLRELLEWCRHNVPPGPFRFASDEVSTQPVRFFAAEYVREAAFEFLGDEVPYAVATEVDEFREDASPTYIRVTIFVERASQRGIVIGRAGRTLRSLGVSARARIEALLGTPVYLDLWVKVLPKWRSRPQTLQRFGFPLPTKEPT